jgi:WD40 repeat protein
MLPTQVLEFTRRFPIRLAILLLSVFAIPSSLHSAEKGEAKQANEPVSFYRQVRPILQRRCAGCHQPAKKGGQLLLTSFDSLKKGGENGSGFVPGKPEESLILEYISGDDPMMPLNSDPLDPQQVQLIARWIKAGAKDDTPASVQETITADNPPDYSSPPVITALAFSPDGKQLAVSGFHEILVHHADGSGLLARLVGRGPRIKSIRYSPDGKLIGSVGGAPAVFGEVQFWNVAEWKLVRSVSISYDTLFGASFSHDGTLFAFGAADNRARILRVKDGKQIMRFDAHADYVLGTTFSLKMDHLITVSRDRSMKLSIIKNAQFVDNITSITPGALKGGLLDVQRHPTKEQVLSGGSDGEPKLYKIFRTRKRKIGDDFNLIRRYRKLPGRIFDLEFSGDGSMFVVGSSTAIGGAARIYKTGDYNTDEINNAGELKETRKAIAARSSKQMLLHDLKGIDSPVYAVAFRPDGKQVAIGGFDGMIRLFDVASGKLAKEFVPVKLTPPATAAK